MPPQYTSGMRLTTVLILQARLGYLRGWPTTIYSTCIIPASAKHLAKIDNLQEGQRRRSSSTSTSSKTRAARPDEVDYALVQNMGQGFYRGNIQISALGTSLNMVYGEWVAPGKTPESCPVVICVHGTPATEGAYRPIGSLIAAGGYRVLAVNFPGMGYTETDPKGLYDYSIPHKAELVKAFISALQLDRVAMVIGHSTGSQVVACIGADPQLQDIVQSICFLCGTGIRSYRAQRLATIVPYLPYLLYRAIYLPFIGGILQTVFARVVRSVGFRGRTPEGQVLSIYEASKLDFELYAKYLVKIREKDLPILIIYAADDAIIEATSTEEKIKFLHIPDENVKSIDEENQSEYAFQSDVLRRVVCFARGSHRVQFKEPKLTTLEIHSFLDTLLSSRTQQS